MIVTKAITSRRSIRAFQDKPVDQAILRQVLETAQRSPSGGNTQPWNAVMLTGEPLAALFAKVAEVVPLGRAAMAPEYHVYPPELEGAYETRRQGDDGTAGRRGERSLRRCGQASNGTLSGQTASRFYLVNRQRCAATNRGAACRHQPLPQRSPLLWRCWPWPGWTLVQAPWPPLSPPDRLHPLSCGCVWVFQQALRWLRPLR